MDEPKTLKPFTIFLPVFVEIQKRSLGAIRALKPGRCWDIALLPIQFPQGFYAGVGCKACGSGLEGRATLVEEDFAEHRHIAATTPVDALGCHAWLCPAAMPPAQSLRGRDRATACSCSRQACA